MSVVYKRIIVFFGVCLMLVGLRLYDNGLAGILRKGSYTAFDAYDRAVAYERVPLLNRRGAYERIDLGGSISDAENLIEKNGGEILKREQIDGVTVIYAYVGRISKCENTSFGRVNLMIALSNGRMTVGSPLIKGSY